MDRPEFQTQLRVIKYDRSDPAYVEDWTSIGDVGNVIRGDRLTLESYLDVETRHLRVVAFFMEEAAVDSMTVTGNEGGHDARWWPQEGEVLSRVDTVDIVRELLRERGWCRLAGPQSAYVHDGWDYYLYLGAHPRCDRTVAFARELGLFVDEDFASPHHIDRSSGDHS